MCFGKLRATVRVCTVKALVEINELTRVFALTVGVPSSALSAAS